LSLNFILYELQPYRHVGLVRRSVILNKYRDFINISLLFVVRGDVRKVQIKGYKIDIRDLFRNTNIILIEEAYRLLLRNKMITNLVLTLVNLRKVAFTRFAHNLRFINRNEDVKELVDVILIENIK
jgi:hypothetical protein